MKVNEYVTKFDNHNEYVKFVNSVDYEIPNVSYCEEEEHVHYSIDYAAISVGFAALEDMEIGFKNEISTISGKRYSSGTVYYSVDGTETWNELPFGEKIQVNANQVVHFKGDLKSTTFGVGHFITTGRFNLFGNPLSMTNMDDYESVKRPTQAIGDMFRSTGVVSAEGLKTNIGEGLSSVSIPNNFFSGFFSKCTNLVKGPEFRNLSRVANGSGMFSTVYDECTALEEAPDIVYESSVGGEGVFMYTFRDCTALKKMPRIRIKKFSSRLGLDCTFQHCTALTELQPVLEIDELGYSETCWGMFEGCTALEHVPKGFLPLTSLTQYCYAAMFRDCTSLKTLPDLPAMNVPVNAYTLMFYGCTGLENVPTDYLPASGITIESYDSMFQDCTSLKNAPELPATSINGYRAYVAMFRGCTSLETAPSVLPAERALSQAYSYMFAGCTSLKVAPEIEALTADTDSFNGMFSGCTSLETAPSAIHVKGVAGSNNRSASGFCMNMFSDCTSLEVAPVIETETFSYGSTPVKPNGCFKEMFKGCTKLKEIKVAFKSESYSEKEQLADWVKGVSSTGNFYMPSDSTWVAEYGDSGVPNGWNIITYEE